MDAEVTLSKAPKPRTELKKTEVVLTPEQRIQAVRDSYALLERTPDADLRDQDRETMRVVGEAKRMAIDEPEARGKKVGSYTIDFGDESDGSKRYKHVKEGIPVDGLIDFLQEQIGKGTLAPDQRDQYVTLRDTLTHGSRLYSSTFNRWSVDKRFERVQHEAYFISIDPARQTGSDKGDWEKAIHELARRRVLVMPRAVPGGGTPPPEPPGAPEPPEPVMTPPEPPEPAPVTDPGTPEPPDAPEPAPAPPEPATPEQVMRDFLIVNRQADLEGHSVLQARQMVRAEMRKGGWNPLRWPKKFGLRLTEKMWEQRISTHLREQMIAHNNSYLDLDLARSSISGLDFFRRGVSHMVVNADSRRDAAHAAGLAKVEETRLRGEAGMGRQIHENIGGPVKDRIIADILRPIADGSLPANTDERRAEVQRRLRAIIHDNRADAAVQEIFGESGRGMEFVASDLLETGQMLRSDVMANRFALDQIDQHVRISLANPTSWGAETEMQNLGFSDKAISWLQKRRSTGAFGDSTIMGAAVSLGIYGIGLGGRRIGSSVAARGASSIGILPVSAIGGSIVGAALAGFRRNYELKVDRATYLTEGAYEMQAAPHARRREKLGEYNYDTVNAAMLLEGGGGEMRDGRTRDSLNMLLGADLTSTGGKEALINRVAEIKTRLDLSSQNNIDLITFSGKENVEQGRLALVQGIVRANAALRAAGMTSAEITAMEATAVTSWQERLSEHRTMQDKAFRNYRIRQSLIAGGIGGVAGLGGAMISQEIATHVLSGNFAPSALERIAGKMGILSSGKALAEMPGNGESIDLGNGLHGTIRGDHIINLVDGNGKSLNIPLQYVDGKVIAQGDYADLPDSVKDAFTGWEHSSVGGSSLREQIRDAVGTPGSEKIRLSGDATLQLDGRELSLFDAKGNLLAHGNVDSGSGEITFDTTNDKALAILEKNGFSVSDISEGATESLRANVSGFIKEIPDDSTERYDLGFVKMDIDGHDTHGMHNVVIRDGDGTMLAKGRISEEGVLKIDMGRNSGVTQAELQPTLNNLRKIGFSVDTKNHGVIEGKPDLRIWEEHGEDINHYEWYAYDTPYSEANELQMHTFKDGDTLILDMGSMGSAYQTGVEPNPILVPEVISDKQAGFAFSLPGHTDKPIFILDAADGIADGQLRLDPNDNEHWIDAEHTMTIGQFTKLIINQEKLGELPDGDIATELYGHQDVFMLRDNDQPGFINAGRIDEREGGKVFQSFATIRGSGRAVTPKDIITITPPSERMGIVMTAPGATEFRLPGVVEAPAIATPFFPRKPLENVIPTEEEEDSDVPPPYGDTYINSEEQRIENASAHREIEEYLRADSFILDTEKDDAVRLAKQFLNRRDAQAFGPQQSELLFRQMYGFLTMTPDLNALVNDDGTVTASLRGTLEPVISDLTPNDLQRDQLTQALGKFFLGHADMLSSGTPEDVEKRIRASLLAYQTAREILE